MGRSEADPRFSVEEWAALAEAPVQAAGMVIAASPSGFEGVAQEIAALSAALLERVADAPADSLVGRLADALRAEVDALTHPGALDEIHAIVARGEALAACRSAAELVAARAAPDEATAYRALLMGAARSVAAAAREGGFLGFGGAQVSDAELAALDELAAAIDSGM